MTEKYISLKEAARYCLYSSDYLKLRARQGKLKAVKMGRNWFTTRDWLETYKNTLKLGHNKPSRGLLAFIRRLLGLFLKIILIIIAFSLLLSFSEPVLERIIPAKVIEIERRL
jgi:hypothetical protein